MKNIHQIKFYIRVSRLNHRAMGLVVRCNDVIAYSSPEVADDAFEINIESGLPLNVEFVTSGKRWNDTMVDQNGNIIQDKFLLIESMSVDGIWIKKWMIESRIFEFVGENGIQTRSNYFGTNGVGKFSIPHQDILEFWLDTLVVDQKI